MEISRFRRYCVFSRRCTTTAVSASVGTFHDVHTWRNGPHRIRPGGACGILRHMLVVRHKPAELLCAWGWLASSIRTLIVFEHGSVDRKLFFLPQLRYHRWSMLSGFVREGFWMQCVTSYYMAHIISTWHLLGLVDDVCRRLGDRCTCKHFVGCVCAVFTSLFRGHFAMVLSNRKYCSFARRSTPSTSMHPTTSRP